MKDFRKLNIWVNAMELTSLVYKYTQSLPDQERFGLVSQMRRSAVSIPSNIAEGCSRSSQTELNRFIEIAIGSAFELETQLLLCENLGYCSNEENQNIIVMLHSIQKQMNQFSLKIKTDINKGQ